jgi:alanine racemase
MKLSKYEPRIEIHHSVILENLKQMKTCLKKNVKIMAVVKSDAYGHGLVEVVKTLEKQVDLFGVGFLNEAFDCCEVTINDIFIMGPVYDFDLVKRQQFILTIENLLQFQGLVAFVKNERDDIFASSDSENHKESDGLSGVIDQKIKPFRIHFKVDTGMARFGLSKDELLKCIQCIEMNQLNDWIIVEGMYSHFSDILMHNEKVVIKQYQLFETFKKIIEKSYDKSRLIYHIANSENALDSDLYQEDMVRLGNGLYGPLALKKPLTLVKAAKVRLPILSIHEKSETGRIGYGLKKKVQKGTKIGIIQVGFYDGFGLIKSPTGQNKYFMFMDYFKKNIKAMIRPEKVYKDEQSYPVIGAINMQFFQIDITGSHLMIGDFVDIKQPPLYFKASVKRLHIMEDQHAINS